MQRQDTMSSHGDSQESQESGLTVMDESREEVLYFAYGSNLSTAQMLQRCPNSTPVGLGRLEGWKWFINQRGYANVARSSSSPEMPSPPEGDVVYGLLYLLPTQDEEALDRAEGVPYAYQKGYEDVAWLSDHRGRALVGERLRPLVYIDVERTVPGLPRAEYVGRMERGIADAVENWGMPEDYAAFMRKHLNKGTQP
jgi:gamma-glutamylcyclotransferase